MQRTAHATTHAGHAAHAAKLGKVLLGGLVLLVLVNPLVKVGLEEVQPLVLLEEARPVLELELLLLELHLNVLGGVVDLALRGVDLGEELELDVVLAVEGARGAGEDERRGLEVQLEAVLGDVGDGDGQVDKVLGGIRVGGALGPENCERGGGLACAASFVEGECVDCSRPWSGAFTLPRRETATAERPPGCLDLFCDELVALPSGVAVSAMVMIELCGRREESRRGEEKSSKRRCCGQELEN